MRAVVASAAFALLLGASRAEADPVADHLFAEATELVAERHFAEAIPKLEEAQRLDPGIGTEFNLGVCYAETGRLAAAWMAFTNVERLARTVGKVARERAAHAYLDELRPRVSSVTIVVREPAPVVVTVDGSPVAKTDLPFYPLDTGEHAIEVRAFGKEAFRETVTIAAEGEHRAVEAPPLADSRPPAETPKSAPSPSNPRRTASWIVGGVGLVGLGTALATGGMILSARSTADERCTPNCWTTDGKLDTTGVDAVERGRTLVPINLVAWGVAAVGLAAGVYLFATSSPAKVRRAAIAF